MSATGGMACTGIGIVPRHKKRRRKPALVSAANA